MLKIGIITGTTSDARVNGQVADYILEKAKAFESEDVSVELVDIKDYDLPLFNGSMPPGMLNKQYETEVERKWSEKIDSLDGFIFVTPEYNKSIPAALKNAIDYLASEFSNKAAGIVSYGSTLGVAASFSLRPILANLNTATVGPFAAFSLFTDFEEMSTFKPSEIHEPTVNSVIETTIAWSKALKTIRE